ncbi:hypothetical protein HY409_04105 [Candidatus Gottesmanbacteria bacterium]|nr:hypothetical protein [Candidatus Gottesmanbacteria bacterium]
MKNYEKIIGILMLLFAIGFNLWIYRLELTVITDPNDNTFQFALVDRTNQIWDFAAKKCSSKFGAWNLVLGAFCQVSYLADHWVPNWSEGYNLPFYYTHIPQILIVTTWRMLPVNISLFTYYHWIIYLLLSFFPISVFIALRVLRLNWLTAGIGALLASHLSTDGLYGLDPPSFLYRGWGLSSQLFAMIFLPLAIAYSWKYLSSQSSQLSVFRFQLSDIGRSVFSRSVTGKPKNGKLETENRPASPDLLRQSDSEARLQRGEQQRTDYSFLSAVFFLVATTMGHLGIGMIALLSLIPLAFAKPIIMILRSESLSNIFEATKIQTTKLLLLIAITIFFLSYWIIPISLSDNFHNISFWDPVWKFNSYGWKETLVRLFNGDLFDFGRFPWFTILTFIGIFAVMTASDKRQKTRIKQSNNITIQQCNNGENDPETDAPSFSGLSVLFVYWLILYFGRTTWGELIDLIPGMKEFHLSRFIVGLHLAGIFLAPIGIQTILENLYTVVIQIIQPSNHPTIQPYRNSYMAKWLYGFIGIAIIISLIATVYPQTIRYAQYNDVLIRKGNTDAALVQKDVDELFTTFKGLPPGRVFAGRGGGWGKDFKVADTPYYMLLSTYGIPTVLWLPETWSPNADTEQYFSDDQEKDYTLYNIRYVVAPPSQATQPFWKLLRETNSWKLYEVTPAGDAVEGIPRDPSNSLGVNALALSERERVEGSIAREGNRGRTRQDVVGYFTSGIRPAIVATDKRSFTNVIRLWIQSDDPRKGLYPELTFSKDFPKKTGLPNFRMLDEVTYQVPDKSLHNLFAERPRYEAPNNPTNE